MIVDRRNELAGNLWLSQELFFIEKNNELVRNGDLAGTKYREIAVDKICLDRPRRLIQVRPQPPVHR